MERPFQLTLMIALPIFKLPYRSFDSNDPHSIHFCERDTIQLEASFKFALLVAKNSKPFTEGPYVKEILLTACESLFSDIRQKDEMIRRIRELPLSNDTVRERVVAMADDVKQQQTKDMCCSPFFSLACDESTDIGDIAQLAIFARYA